MHVAHAEGPPAKTELDQAAAGSERDAQAEALFRLAELDDKDGRYKAALEKYEASVARSPSSRYVPRASARATVLRTHAEGDFAPFARLEAVRINPKRADDPAEIDALARDAEGFPEGLVRVEARMVVAEAYLGRLGRPDDGIAMLRKVAADPNADPLTGRHAARALVEALVSKNDLPGAVQVTHDLGPALDPLLAKRVATLVRRTAVHRGALAVLGLRALFAGSALLGAARKKELVKVARAAGRTLPLVFLFAAYTGLAGGALASAYESGNSAPFLALGAVLMPLVLVARAWGAAGSTHPALRAARAVLCASTVLAAAFLVLESVDTSYLAGFGL